MLMRADYELSPVYTIGPVRIFTVLGVENSLGVLSAIVSKTSVQLPPIRFDREVNSSLVLLFLLFLIRDYGFSIKFVRRLNPDMHYPV